MCLPIRIEKTQCGQHEENSLGHRLRVISGLHANKPPCLKSRRLSNTAFSTLMEQRVLLNVILDSLLINFAVVRGLFFIFQD